MKPDGNRIQPLVVVGIDGSPASTTALRWAAAEATRRGAILRIVHAWAAPAPIPWTLGGVSEVDLGLVERAARTVAQNAVATLVGALGDGAPDLDPMVVEGPAVAVLVEAARHADLLVVGTRGHGRLASTLLGSTATGCARRSPVPVAVVRDHPTSDRGGEVVVGFDDTPASRAALRWAVRFAAASNVPVRVVQAWSPDLAAPIARTGHASPFDECDPTPGVERRVSDCIADLDPRPPIAVDVVTAPAGPALIDAARTASLLVVGTHGHSDAVGLVLGTVSNRCLHRSPCTVVIVPVPSRRTSRSPAAEQVGAG